VAQVGTVIADRYELREQISAGSTGEVWHACDTRLNRMVAAKLLADDVEVPARSTPLVTVYDRGTQDGQAWLVMEYPSGGSVRDLLDARGTLSEHDVMTLIAKAAQALQAAHSAGVVHRDLRPGHILLRSDGSVAIIDAGLAPGWWAPAQADRWAVRAPYLAPEQVRGAPVTAATDLYALGVVGYECLIGRVPFQSADPAETAVRAARTEPPSLPPQISSAARAVLQKAMAKDPAARWPNADAMAAAADAAAQQAAVREQQAAHGEAAQAASGRSADEALRGPTMQLPTEPAAGADAAPSRNATTTVSLVLGPVRRARTVYVLVAAAVVVLLIAIAFLVPERNGRSDRTGPGGSRDTHALGDTGNTGDNGAVVAVPGLASPSASPTVSASGSPAAGGSGGTGTAPAPRTTVPAPPPGPTTYMVPANTITPEFKDGTCVYRVLFGNFGSAAFAQVHFYSGNCGGSAIEVAALRTGLVLTWEAANGQEVSGATDSCGSSYVEQATSKPDPAYGVGARITFGETHHVLVFMDGSGKTPPVVRTC
jgi:eukaryotic-like serine/threonine-protein kinase